MENEFIKNLADPEVIERIWQKAIVVEGYDPSLYRKDFAEAWIARDSYADCNSPFGWEIDHVYPESLGGDNHFINLRPMNWRNNRSKGDSYPQYNAVVTSDETRNIDKDVNCTVNTKLQNLLKTLYQS